MIVQALDMILDLEPDDELEDKPSFVQMIRIRFREAQKLMNLDAKHWLHWFKIKSYRCVDRPWI